MESGQRIKAGAVAKADKICTDVDIMWLHPDGAADMATVTEGCGEASTGMEAKFTICNEESGNFPLKRTFKMIPRQW